MIRTLFPAFLLALIFHLLLARLDLDLPEEMAPKRKIPDRVTINIVNPKPVNTTISAKKPSLITREPERFSELKNRIRKIETKLRPKQDTRKRELKAPVPVKKKAPKEKTEIIQPHAFADLPVKEKSKDSGKNKITPFPQFSGIPEIRDKKPGPGKSSGTNISKKSIGPKFTQPDYRKNPPPEFPLLARIRGYHGKVTLNVLVDKQGEPSSVKILKSSGYDILDRSAVHAVKKWKFIPAKKGDQIVETWVKVPLRFELQ